MGAGLESNGGRSAWSEPCHHPINLLISIRSFSRCASTCGDQPRRRRERQIRNRSSPLALRLGVSLDRSVSGASRCDTVRRELAQPSWKAIDSCRNLEHVRKIGNALAMLQSVGEHSQRQGLGLGNRISTRLSVRHDTGQFGNVGDPSAIDFLLNFDLHDSSKNIRQGVRCPTSNENRGRVQIGVLKANDRTQPQPPGKSNAEDRDIGKSANIRSEGAGGCWLE